MKTRWFIIGLWISTAFGQGPVQHPPAPPASTTEEGAKPQQAGVVVRLDLNLLLAFSRSQTQVALVKPLYDAAITAWREKQAELDAICRKAGQTFDDASFACKEIPKPPEEAVHHLPVTPGSPDPKKQ